MPIEVTVQEETSVTEHKERSTRRSLSKERNENTIHPEGHTDGEGIQMEDTSGNVWDEFNFDDRQFKETKEPRMKLMKSEKRRQPAEKIPIHQNFQVQT